MISAKNKESPLLRLDNVSKSFKNAFVLNRISGVITRGEIFGLLGPNGAGKTTLIRTILGILPPDSGTLFFNDHPISEEDRKKIGYLPEERGLYRKWKVLEILAFIGELKGLSAKEAKSRALSGLEELGLPEWKNNRTEELSKGMQQKVQILSTLLSQPEFLVLDEPYVGLDPTGIAWLQEKIMQLKEKGTTVLLCTHLLDLAEKISSDIFLLHKGKMILSGALQKIRNQFKENALLIETPDEIPDMPGTTPKKISPNIYEVTLDSSLQREALLEVLLNRGIRIKSFQEKMPSLPEIFVQATKEP